MTLVSLELVPRAEEGWGSGRLEFGRCTTLLLGPNGAGKTPVMKAIAYALGQPVSLPPEVYSRVGSVRLGIAAPEGVVTIERFCSENASIVVRDTSGAELYAFGNDKAFSEWLLPVLGVSLRPLVHLSGVPAAPYLSVFGPVFVVDQDSGWKLPYEAYAAHRFVRDQREEVLRWVLEVPSRNRVVERNEYDTAKVTQLAMQQQVAVRRRVLEDLTRELGPDAEAGAAELLFARLASAEEQFRTAYVSIESVTRVDGQLARGEREAADEHAQLKVRLSALERRRKRLGEVEQEVIAEIAALEENQIAATAFRSFCGNETCQFFRRPEDSFGRRMLYLRDQLKDFVAGSSETAREYESVRAQVDHAEHEATRVAALVAETRKSSGASAAIGAVRELSEQMAALQARVAKLKQLDSLRAALERSLLDEARQNDLVLQLRPTGGARREVTRLREAQHLLASSFAEWLEVLRTPNLSGPVAVDDELYFVVKGERLKEQSSHSGSSRARMVLAAHAALLEASVEMDGSHPRLLCLDAPRQQELSAQDLREFVKQFYTLFGKRNPAIQLVFSATEASVASPGCVDATWRPSFEHGKSTHFLG